MDFTFTEEQQMGAELTRRILCDLGGSKPLRHWLSEGEYRDEPVWLAMKEAGLAGVLVPEGAGGLGSSEIDFVLIAQACGYSGLAGSLVEHAGIAAPLLANSGDNSLAPRAGGSGETRELARQAAAGEIRLSTGHPINPFVMDADRAHALLLEHAGEVHLVRPDPGRLTRKTSIDPFRRLFSTEWTPSPATRIADASVGKPLWDDALDRGALFTAAQCLGIAQRTVDLAVSYAKERKQFGKPIGSYQAVKHLLASVQVKIEFARPVVHAAAADFQNRDAMSRARISHAKLVACEVAEIGARTALQVYGAMGYSWEVDLHFFLKRALALTYAWGDPAFHRARVAKRMFDHPIGPEHTFSRQTRTEAS